MNNFPFFILINYNEAYSIESLNIFANGIKKYLVSENYIKIRGKPILGIFSSSMTIQLIFPFKNIDLKSDFIKQYFYNFFYSSLIKEKNIKTKSIRNFFIINGSRPEKFYIIFKKYLNLINPDKETFILFNAWNNYEKNFFLEPSEEFGFTYLNYLSKAIFKLDNDSNYDLKDLWNKSKIAIQIHIFYEDLIMDIINRTNNIPVKFDLYITVTSPEIKNRLENNIKGF